MSRDRPSHRRALGCFKTSPTMINSSSRVLLFDALLGAALVPAFASGSYSGRPPKPPAVGGEMKMDRAKYGLGQKIYEGRATLTGGGSAEAQRERLKMAQAKLPADAMKIKDLPALAGKLSAGEFAVLV